MFERIRLAATLAAYNLRARGRCRATIVGRDQETGGYIVRFTDLEAHATVHPVFRSASEFINYINSDD